MDLEFRSHVGHQPWFFVPDTGTQGGTAVLIDPDGGETEVTETQLSPRPDADGTQRETMWGPRVGFQVPYPFDTEGDYQLIVTQDDVVTTYEIHVLEARRVVVDERTGKSKLVTGGTAGVPERMP